MDQMSSVRQERVQIHLSAQAASPGFRAAGRACAEKRSTIRDGWRDVLADATCEVFEIMVGTSLGRATDESPHVVADYTAMIGLAGTVCGVLGLRTSFDSARRIAARMLGSDEIGENENVLDAFGEVCNMVAGSFKAKIAGLADGCALSVPMVISGKDYALYALADGERFEVKFFFEGKPLAVSLDLHS
jgi:chemotaxis protein CheX